MNKEWIEQKIKEAHKNAVEKRFYDCPECGGSGLLEDPEAQCSEYPGECVYDCPACNGTGIDPNKNIGELLMLIVSELGEALEAHRCGRFADWTGNAGLNNFDNFKAGGVRLYCWLKDYEKYIKDTFEDKIADAIIGLFDLCGYKLYNPKISDYDKSEIPDNIGQCLLSITHQVCHMSLEEMFYNTTLTMLFSFCQHHNIPIEKHIEAKMAYNKTRQAKLGSW